MSFTGKFYFKDGREIEVGIGEKKLDQVTEALKKKEAYKDDNCRFFINIDNLNYYLIAPSEVINNTLNEETQDDKQ